MPFDCEGYTKDKPATFHVRVMWDCNHDFENPQLTRPRVEKDGETSMEIRFGNPYFGLGRKATFESVEGEMYKEPEVKDYGNYKTITGQVLCKWKVSLENLIGPKNREEKTGAFIGDLLCLVKRPKQH